MAAPSTGADQSGFLSEENVLSSATKLQQTNRIRGQPIQRGVQLNQHRIVQKLPNAVQSTHKINTQQLDKTTASNIIAYRLTQKKCISADQPAQRINVFHRSGSNVKLINGYGLAQVHEASINNGSEKKSDCPPEQEISVPLQFKISPNVTTGWLRQIADGDIVYVR